MEPTIDPFSTAEAAYRRERITADFSRTTVHHRPIGTALRRAAQLVHWHGPRNA